MNVCVLLYQSSLRVQNVNKLMFLLLLKVMTVYGHANKTASVAAKRHYWAIQLPSVAYHQPPRHDRHAM